MLCRCLRMRTCGPCLWGGATRTLRVEGNWKLASAWLAPSEGVMKVHTCVESLRQGRLLRACPALVWMAVLISSVLVVWCWPARGMQRWLCVVSVGDCDRTLLIARTLLWAKRQGVSCLVGAG